MAEVEEWWQHVYPKFSLQRLEENAVYQRFCELQAPYSATIGQLTETLASDSEKDEFTSTNERDGSHERLTHNIQTEEWTYEHRFREQECDTVVVATLHPRYEKGEIVRTFFDCRTTEAWERSPDRLYSKRVQTASSVHSLSSFFEGLSGGDGWLEVSFSSGTTLEFERVNFHGDMRSGETKHMYGERSWGKVWTKDVDVDEWKSWHRQGNLEWGHTHGNHRDEKVWDYHYWIRPEETKEDRLMWERNRYRGFWNRRKGRDYVQVEWEGKEVKPQLADVERETENILDVEKVRRTVAVEYDLALESISTLRLMVQSFPNYKRDLLVLDEELSHVSPNFPLSLPDLLSNLNSLQDFHRRLEHLKREIMETSQLSIEKYEGLHQPLEDLAQSSIEAMESRIEPLLVEPEVGSGLTDLKKEAEAVKGMEGPYLARIRAWTELLKKLNVYTVERFPKAEEKAEEKTAQERPGDAEEHKVINQIASTQEATLGRLSELISDPQEMDETAKFHEDFSNLNTSKFATTSAKLLLVLERQGTLFRLIEKLKGAKAEDIAKDYERVKGVVEETADYPNLAAVKKTKSGRDPLIGKLNQTLDSLSSRLLQLFSIIHPDAPEDAELLEDRSRDPIDPVPLLVHRTERLQRVCDYMGGYMDRLYRAVLLVDKQMSRALKLESTILPELDCPPAITSECQRLAPLTVRTIGESLLLAKIKHIIISLQAIKAAERSLADVVEELSVNNDELDELLRQKSEEIVYLTKEIDEKERKMRERQEELLLLRKFKSTHEENGQALFAAQIKIRDLELRAGTEDPTCTLVDGDVRPHCLRYLLELLRKRRQLDQSLLLQQWKSHAISPFLPSFSLERLSSVPSTAWPATLDTDYITEADAKDLDKADSPLAAERLALIKSNPVLKTLQGVKTEGKSPLSSHDFYAFCEAAIREKLARDEKDLSSGMKPSNFPEFLIEYTISTAENKEKGCEHLLRLLFSLENLYGDRQTYAVFLARMLQVLDPHPATLEAQLLALQHWQKLAYMRTVSNESLVHGGELPLTEAVEAYYSEFRKDPAALQILLSSLRPPSMSLDSFGLFLLSWRLRSIPSPSLTHFSSPMQRADLLQLIKDDLDLNLPKAVFNSIWTHMKTNTDLSPEAVMGEIGGWRAEEGTVRVADVLIGLLDAHEWERKKVARRVMHEIPKVEMGREEFFAFYQGLDPSVRESWLSDLADQLTESATGDPFSEENVIQLLATHPPEPLQSSTLRIERLHSSLETRLQSSFLDTDCWDSPVKRVRLIRTTETVLRTTRTQLKARRKS